ncbi:hypothetical protein [Blastopirellula marina]|uniref:Uncharacterized protein n=1 Tax=Blastopirellula marina TaxID=124 RepID=A0A2S8G2R4_9BACT|nr:hypothetical protein [Blastopirellula marina]PQO38551.1 hypothetical protein C5Y98_10915 [Blastopirellula marina]PTL45208.1 hypothetical protein C5Y97_10925 [Blastopirellula marina]
MPEPSSFNPFASPEIEDVPAYSGPSHQTKSMARWVGLSTLSGVLLFAAYFVGVMAFCFAGTALIFAPDQISLRMLTPFGIYCSVAGIYGVLVGFVVGITFGFISYWAPTGRGVYTLYVFGMPFSVLMTVVSPLIFLYNVYLVAPSNDILIPLAWTICFGLFALIASAHLTRNIRRFLIKPLEVVEAT